MPDLTQEELDVKVNRQADLAIKLARIRVQLHHDRETLRRLRQLVARDRRGDVLYSDLADVLAILDREPERPAQEQGGIADRIPDQSVTAHRAQGCPGCAGDLGGLHQAGCSAP